MRNTLTRDILLNLTLVIVLAACGSKKCKDAKHNDNLQWPRGETITFQYSSSMLGAYKPDFEAAINKQDSILLNLRVRVEDTGLDGGPKQDGINGIYFTNQSLGQNIIAITYTTHDNNTLTDTDIVFNTAMITSNANSHSFMYLTSLHEIGHAIGLGHSDDVYSVMFPSINMGLVNNPFSDDYIKQVSRRYGVR